MSKKTTTTRFTDTLKLKARNDYVQGIDNEEGAKNMPTLDELAKKYKVAKSTLYRVAKKEAWKVDRERFQIQYMAKLDKERVKNLHEESIKFDTTSLNIAKSLMVTVGQAINTNALDKQQGKKGLPPNQLNALANTAIQAQRLAKLALGEATDNMNLNANIQDADAFREAMELLDSVAEQRRESNDKAVH